MSSFAISGMHSSNDISQQDHLKLIDTEGAIMRVVTVGGKLTLEWDSQLRNGTDERLYLSNGLSKEIWDYVSRHSGLERIYLPPTNTWGSKKVLNEKSTDDRRIRWKKACRHISTFFRIWLAKQAFLGEVKLRWLEQFWLNVVPGWMSSTMHYP